MMNRVPSLKRLEDAFPGKGGELRALLKGEKRTKDYKSVQDLITSCHHRPSYAHRLMVAFDEILDGFGVEDLCKGDECIAEYVNLGDTYVTTIIRKIDTGSIILASWGDFAESNRL